MRQVAVNQTNFKWLIALFCLGLLLCLPGCGGGTVSTGSGPDTVSLSGEVRSLSNKVIPGAEITDLRSGDNTFTDDKGRFTINAVVQDASLDLLVRQGNFEGRTQIDVPSDETKDLLVKITVDSTSGIVSAVIVELLDTDGPTSNGKVTQSFNATITSTRNIPLKDVKLSIPKYSVSSRSDKNGHCHLNTVNAGGTVKFNVVYDEVKGSFSLSSIPQDRSSNIKFKLKLSIDEGQVDPGTGKPTRKLNIEVVQ